MTDWLTTAAALRGEVFARFLEPQTRQLVTYAEHWKHGWMPTPEEAASAIPNGPSYSTGIEDATLRGSALLAAMCDEYDLSGDEELKRQAHVLFGGIQRTQDLADPPGFVPRWVLPDGKTSYPKRE